MFRLAIFSVFAAALLTLDAEAAAPLQPCHLPGVERPLRCAEVEVFEDRGAGGGRRIPISIVVVPAQQRDRRPDPLVLLAGGPGQAARDLAGLVEGVFGEVRRRRDIVLIDARGVGGSNPLNCPGAIALFGDGTSLRPFDPQECLESLKADVRWYANETIADDLAEVLDLLGYPRVNLWGGSFGSRTALIFSRRHPDRVRSAILESPAPFALRFPMHVAADSQRALDRLLEDCQAEPDCGREFPNLAFDLERLTRQLGEKPRTVSVRSPLTGRPLKMTVDDGFVADAVRAALYLPNESSLLPFALRSAAQEEFGPLTALTSRMIGATVDTMALGATLSVLCTEDVPFVEVQEAAVESRETLFGDRLVREWRKLCASWPRGTEPDRTPRLLPIPALVVTGDLDPVTPPRWGEEMLRSFPQGRHVVVAGAGHNPSLSGCLPDLMAQFIESADPENLDLTCTERGVRPGFVVDSTAARSRRTER